MVVTHESAADLGALIDALRQQARHDDEIAIVDNASEDGTAELARAELARAELACAELARSGTVVETGANLGFAAACHIGVDATKAPLLLFLNPDAVPEPDCLAQLRAAAERHPEWGAWQAAVLLDSEQVNSSGGVVHFLGIGWAGDCGRPVALLPSADREVAFPSGAAMVVRRSEWERLGGLDAEYFMYCEDLDLGLRMWLSGVGVGIVPAARVRHGYEFDKGQMKWFWLERNRWRTVLSVYPAPLLALLAPALLLAELALLAVAARQGWLAPKLRAQRAVLAGLPRTLARRRAVQATRRVGAARFAERLTAVPDSEYLAAAGRPALTWPLMLYWKLVRRVLSVLAG